MPLGEGSDNQEVIVRVKGKVVVPHIWKTENRKNANKFLISIRIALVLRVPVGKREKSLRAIFEDLVDGQHLDPSFFCSSIFDPFFFLTISFLGY